MAEFHGISTSTKTLDEFDADPSASIALVSRSATRVIVQQDGVPLAALISVEDFEELRRLEAERDQDFAVLDEIHDTFRGIPTEELEREAEKALSDVRAERLHTRQRPAQPA